jgi:AcrR family transcriptional regulator
MGEPVKQTRRYDATRRREQAAATRRDILDAAQRLFERDGYAATTMAAIAKEARVALKTVYIAFDTKSGLLRALWHLLLRGDEEDVPVPQRAWYLEVLDEPDPERALRLGARGSTIVKRRIGGILEVIRGGAATDPDVAALWSRIQSELYDNQRAIVERIAARGGLRDGLDVDRAADILWTLIHPSIWQCLVVERGWTPEQHEEWLAETSCAQLLG